MEPRISVLMSVYNTREPWLRASVESILNQTLRDLEFIIVVDCPTDGSASVIREYAKKDNRVRVIENEENLGLTKSLNRGLAAARGTYIARMDADDISFADRLEKEAAYLDTHPKAAAVGSLVTASLDPAHALDKFPLSTWTPDPDLLKIRMLFKNAGIPHPTSMYRRSLLTERGITYDERMKKSQDYTLWIALSRWGTIDVIMEPLLMWRVHDGQISAGRKNQMSYAHMAATEQAEALCGPLTDLEKELHATATDPAVSNVRAFSAYLKKLAACNEKQGFYDRKKFVCELDCMYIQKALRRLVVLHKADMLFTPEIFKIFKPSVVCRFAQNKMLKAKRRRAVRSCMAARSKAEENA